MTNIEYFLIRNGFALYKTYDSGVLEYAAKDDDGWLSDKVALYMRHEPRCWMIDVGMPCHVLIENGDDYGEDEVNLDVELFKEHIEYCRELNSRMNAVENPFEEVEGDGKAA